MKNQKKFTVKLENIGSKNQTVFVYGLTKVEDKSFLFELIDGFLTKNRNVGEKFEAWKLCGTSYTFKFTKQINNNILQFDVA